MSYRENAKSVEEIFPPRFGDLHPRLKRAGALALDWLRGILFIAVLVALFPGLYYLGGWFGNDVMHWGLPAIAVGPQRWALGVGLMLTPIAVVYGPIRIGRWFKSLRP